MLSDTIKGLIDKIKSTYTRQYELPIIYRDMDKNASLLITYLTRVEDLFHYEINYEIKSIKKYYKDTKSDLEANPLFGSLMGMGMDSSSISTKEDFKSEEVFSNISNIDIEEALLDILSYIKTYGKESSGLIIEKSENTLLVYLRHRDINMRATELPIVEFGI